VLPEEHPGLNQLTYVRRVRNGLGAERSIAGMGRSHLLAR
jgi:hypothetical protein